MVSTRPFPVPTQVRRRELQATLHLAAEVYPQLCELANQFLRSERVEPSTQATALVHEALLRLGVHDRPRSSRHLVGIAAHVMRRVLIDRARRRRAWMRFADTHRAVDDAQGRDPRTPLVDIDSLASALGELERQHPRAARVAELRYLQGWSVDRTAQFLGVSRRTVNSDWATAREHLARRLAGEI
ncbi:MAG: ECF-type sigma factor [Planctomycetota bacterium]